MKIVIEGTPEEIADLQKRLGLPPPAWPTQPPVPAIGPIIVPYYPLPVQPYYPYEKPWEITYTCTPTNGSKI